MHVSCLLLHVKNSNSLTENTNMLLYLYISTFVVVKLTLMLTFLRPVTCWLSTWWDCSNIYIWGVCSWVIPDIKVIWYRIESQSGKASVSVTVVVQCDGSQGDCCGEYEQQFPITTSRPQTIVDWTVLFLSKIRVGYHHSGYIALCTHFPEDHFDTSHNWH